MKRTVVTGGHLVSPIEDRLTDLTICDGLIEKLGPATKQDLSGATNINASGCWVTPGLIDLQVNGGPSCDFWADPDAAQVGKFAAALAKAGVTTILPTLITDDIDHLRKNIAFLESEIGVGTGQLEITNKPALAVRMPGIHLEGPCLSPAKPGVHPSQHLQALNIDLLKQIITGSVKLMTLAPELDPTGLAIKYLFNHGVNVAIGHSNATFEEAEKAFDQGVVLMTHTFNALPPIHHRTPGAVTAALLDDRVTCCAIADGQHLAPAAVKLIFKVKGLNKTVLVTDMAHIGTSQGGLVGSSIFLSDAVANAVQWGVATFQQAIQMATLNPAVSMGWQDKIGYLGAGKLADIVIWHKQSLAIKHVIVGGELLL